MTYLVLKGNRSSNLEVYIGEDICVNINFNDNKVCVNAPEKLKVVRKLVPKLYKPKPVVSDRPRRKIMPKSVSSRTLEELLQKP